MRVLTYVLCGICLAGGAVTSLAMTQLSPADDRPTVTTPGRSVEPDRVREADFFPRTDEPLLKDNEPESLLEEVSDPFGKDPGVRGPNRPSQSSTFGNPAAVGNMPARGPMRARQVRRTVIQTHMEPVPAEELAAAKKLQEAIKSLNNSSDPEAQKKATDTIQQQLSEQFDLDLKQREKELAEVEAKVKSLREKLDKRKAAREDIISLRLKTITNDAAGLGFPGGAGANEAADDFPSVDVAESLNEVRVYAPPNGPVYTVPRSYSQPGGYPVPAISPPVALPVSPGLPAATPEPLPANPISPEY